jgi:large subunit ribosomal protein L4
VAVLRTAPRNEKSYAQKVNKQARQKALLVALSRKFKDGEILFIDSLELAAPKTKEAKMILTTLSQHLGGFKKKSNAALIALPTAHTATQKSFANIGNVEMVDVRNLNPLLVLSNKYLVIANPAAAVEVLGAKRAAQTK